MMESAHGYLVERRTDERFEAARQEAESLMDEVEGMFSEIERAIGPSDFGREVLDKARKAVDLARSAIEHKNTDAVKEQVEQLLRAQRMFRGVVSGAH